MLHKRGLWILLLVGCLALLFLYAGFVGSQPAALAQPKGPCTTCVWLPLLAQDTQQGTPLEQAPPPPASTPLPQKPLPPAPPPSGIPNIANPNIVPAAVTWTLGELVVVAAGSTVVMPADAATGFPGGTMMSGYTLQASAATPGSQSAPDGQFRLTLSGFAPAADYLGQRAGTWYVQGTWTMTQQGADAAQAAAIERALKVRHNPYALGGTLRAELPFDPSTGAGGWTGLLTLPMSPAAGRWSRGAGTFSVDKNMEASIHLDVLRWPEMP